MEGALLTRSLHNGCLLRGWTASWAAKVNMRVVNDGGARSLSFWEAGRQSGGSGSGTGRSCKPGSCGRTERVIVERSSSREGALLCSLVGALASASGSDPAVVQKRAEPYHRSWPLGRLATLLALASSSF